MAGHGDFVCVNGEVGRIQQHREEATGAAPGDGDGEVWSRMIGLVLCELGQAEGIK
jgi:hypothetical protein